MRISVDRHDEIRAKIFEDLEAVTLSEVISEVAEGALAKLHAKDCMDGQAGIPADVDRRAN